MKTTSDNGNKPDGLSESERISLRNSLLFLIREHPVKIPLGIRIRDLFDFTTPAPQSLVFARPLAAVFSLLFVIGIGTATAAENAVPGDALYGFKTAVNEPVRGALAVTNSQKAEWNTELLSRRLEEAESLAALGKLTPVARADIETRIDETKVAFDQSASALASDDATGYAAAQSDLEASLEGHERVLAALGANLPTTSRQSVLPILASVRLRAAASQTDRTHAEAAIATNNGSTVKAAAIDKKNTADQAVSTARAKVSAALVSGASSSTKEANEVAFNAEQALAAGNQKLDRGQYGAAFGTFQAAIRAAETATVSIDAEQKLKTDLSLPDASTTDAAIIKETASSTSATSTPAESKSE